jgi:DNA mismatch repair protein MutS2
VLLDELGAGTDPQEGAALARAILAELLERSITTLVATHYPELKTYAHSTPGVNNASMEFDLQSLRPTYHLHIGLPGRSNALAIAARLGLEEKIVENARAMLSTADLEAEQLLDEIHTQRELTRKDRNEAETRRQQVVAMEEELSERLQDIDKEREDILIAAQQKADLELENLRSELRKIKQEFSRTRQTKEDLKEAEKQIESLGKSMRDSLPVEDEEKPIHSYKVGDAVFLRTISAEGVIQSLDQDHAEVQVGRLRVRAALNELLPAGEESLPKRKKETRSGRASRDRRSISTPIVDSPPLELHIRGWTIEDALEALDRRLDAAFLAGMPYLRVVHGKGTGRLRRAVRQALQSSPYVASFESGQPAEGGEGVTVVHLNVT